jgi:neutral ceramidase
MNLGAAQIDITPTPGVELSGFAARIQPSVGVLDPLFAKALYLLGGETRLLWIHCDLVGFDRSIVIAFRRWAQDQLGLGEGQVMLSATHTHSGACTIHLQECGKYDPVYVEFLQARLRDAAQAAVAVTEPVEMVAAEGNLNLAVDRRKTASPHTDPRVAALGFRRGDRTFAAAIVNYAMHPVALGPMNRCISADMSGSAAAHLAASLPGKPVVLVTNGACANLNPPAENVTFEQVKHWGGQIADAVAPLLSRQLPARNPGLRVLSRTVRLPLDTLDADGINRFADRALFNAGPLAEWGDKYRRVVEHWRTTLLGKASGRDNGHQEAELFGVGLGDVVLVGANAEVFSEFTDMLRRRSPSKIYLIGYANGDMGYLPTRAAYAEGGYEVEVAHMFYGGFRPKAGALEMLAATAADLVDELAAGPRAPGAAGKPKPPHGSEARGSARL